MKIKTYGMPGLLEWHGIVSSGTMKMKVSFTNGTVTGYGVAPATFITKDSLTQFVIEHSEKFQNGRIILIREIEVADDAETKTRKARLTDETKGSSSAAMNIGGNIDDIPLTDDTISDGIKVNVADRNEAIEYLKEHFADKNYTATGLRTKTAFEAACKECGVEFEFTV